MRFEKLRVEDLMSTAVITVTGTQTVGQADAQMQLAQVRHLPVVSDRQHLIGILSNRDIGAALAAGFSDLRLAEVMTPQVFVVPAAAPAARAAALMLEHKIGALPVVGERGQLVGIITETDFLEVAHRVLNGAAH